MNKKKFDVHERVYRFVLRSLKLLNLVPKNQINLIILKQAGRSIASVGANDREADGVNSKADFIHCYTVTRKELKESLFWLRILGDLNPKLKDKLINERKKGEELIKIISKIIINAKSKIR